LSRGLGLYTILARRFFKRNFEKKRVCLQSRLVEYCWLFYMDFCKKCPKLDQDAMQGLWMSSRVPVHHFNKGKKLGLMNTSADPGNGL